MPEAMIRTRTAARLLDVTPTTVARWWRDWHPHAPLQPGRGNGVIRLSEVDLMVARAWAEITNGRGGESGRARRPCALAERAIRRHPQPWLLLTEHSARTYPTAVHAAQAWLALGALAGRVIHVGEGPCC